MIDEKINKCRREVDEEINANRERIEALHACVKGVSDDINKMRSDHKTLYRNHEELGAEISSRIGKLESQLNRLQEAIDKILDIFEAGEGFAKVMSWLGKIAKWVTVIVSAVVAVWVLIKHGGGHG